MMSSSIYSCIWIFVSLVLLVKHVSSRNGTSVKLAYLTDYKHDFRHIGGAFLLAIEHHKSILSPLNISVEYVTENTRGDDVIGYKSMIESANNNNATAFFGPAHYCSCSAGLATALDIPYMAYDCVYTPNEANTSKYHVVSTQPSDTKVVRFILAVMKHYNWTSYTIIGGVSDKWKETARLLTKLENEAKIQSNPIRAYPENDRYHPKLKDEVFRNMIRSTYNETRVYVFLGNYFSLIRFLVAMEELGYTDTGEYVVIATKLDEKTETGDPRYFRSIVEEKIPVDVKRLKAFRNVLILRRTSADSEQWEDTGIQIDNRNQMPPINLSRPSFFPRPPIPLKAAYLYDAVKLYLEAVRNVAMAGGDIFNASQIVSKMRNKSYESIYGLKMHISDTGDNDGNYTLWSIKVKDGVPQDNVTNVGRFIKESADVVYIPDTTNKIGWVSGFPPVSNPVCGFKGDKCDTEAGVSNHTVIIVCTLLGIALVVAAVLAVRHCLYEKKLEKLLWKVNRSEIKFLDERDMGTIKKPKKMHHRWTSLLMPKDSDLEDLCAPVTRTEQELTVGTYRGTQVVIKQVTKKTLEMSRSLKKQLQRRKELNHDNINRFVGACIETPQIYILSQYCTRRSLHDIIQDEDTSLDDIFVSSLLADLIKGMTFIHDSRIISHGNLKSSNCLVDSRWVLQIADFGLHSLYSSGQSFKDETKHYNRLKWRAPELLRESNHEPRGTQKGDVYAFALILFDIHGRKGPWGDVNYTMKEIVQKVRDHGLEPPFRPPTDVLKCQQYIVLCMKECWAELAEARPDFKVIKIKLREMHNGLKNNIFDNMMLVMEKYANTLEQKVAERTQELSIEKRMTENLLLRMLPRSVAERLKQNEPVIPENYECVSIYFSDIVGFTQIAAQSTPMQVVSLLNDLYICFDSEIENYDVYKVETIGDAYMVVSGLPFRNDDRHAGEVASLSLNVLNRINNFKIQHMPDTSIQIRIGLHSGPCCAGVVGLKMPRYCLFGDTVNVASRMESTGEGMKIHCSQLCKDKLDVLGGYYLQERGIINVKGKGAHKTYFLLGEDPGHRVRRISKEKVPGTGEGRCVSMGNLDYGGKPLPNAQGYRNNRMLRGSGFLENSHSDKPHELVPMQELDSGHEEPTETEKLLSMAEFGEVPNLFENNERAVQRYVRTFSCDNVALTRNNSWGPVVYTRSNSQKS